MAGDSFHGPTAEQHGDHGRQTNNFYNASRPRARWPYQVGVLPPRAECFQGRAEVAQLRRALAGGGTAVVGPAGEAPAGGAPVGEVLAGGVLAGLGGVGKTQLAADYARTAWSSGGVDVLVWITAGSRSAVVAGYAQAAAEVLGAEIDDPEAAARAFLAWLEPKAGPGPCRWLGVLDDVADPAGLNGLWPPPSPRGRTLATSRRRDAALTGPSRRRIEVGEFSPGEAADYLNTVLAAHGRTEPADEIAGLAADLGRLPLALSQAAAYMADAGRSCAAYRTLLGGRARTLAELSPDVLPDGQSHTMAAAWSLSMDYADQLRPAGLARPMLQLAAFLDPNGIPAGILTSPPALDHLTAHRTPAGEGEDAPPVGADDADGALRALHRLSLLQASDDSSGPGSDVGMVRVHQVVQRATRDTLSPPQYGRTARTAADALTAVWPRTERDTVLAQALRTNATTLATHAETALHQPDAHLVLFRTGTSLGESGQLTAVIGHCQQLAATTHHHLGPDHPVTLIARGNLARWRGEAGDVAGAVAACADLLADRERVLGPDHPDILNTRGHLAYWLDRSAEGTSTAD